MKPDDPDAKFKSIAADALQGVGSLVVDAFEDRFVISCEGETS